MKLIKNTFLLALFASTFAQAQFQQSGFPQQQPGMTAAPNAPQGGFQMQGGAQMSGVQAMPGQMGELPSGGESTALSCGVNRMAVTNLGPGSVPMGGGAGSH